MERGRVPPRCGGPWILWLLPALAGAQAGEPAAGPSEERTVTGVRGRAVELGCGPAAAGAAAVFWSFAGPPGTPGPWPRAVAAAAAGGRAALAPGVAAALGPASVRNGSLRLGRLRPAAQGRFLCQALLLRPEPGPPRAASAAVRLRVLVPVSKPAVRPATAAVAEGAAAALRCAVREGSAPLRFSWRRGRDGDGDDDGDGDLDGATWHGPALRLAPAARSHAGWYSCTARNEVSSRRSAPAYLDVAYGPDAPVITAGGGGGGRRAVAAAEGAALVLRCRAASWPRCRYAWLRDGGRLQRGATLALPRLAPAHAGTYACLARNPRTRARARAVLRLAVRPRPPTASYAAPAVAAVGGMLLAATAALLAARYIARNRDNHPRLHELLFRTAGPAAPRDTGAPVAEEPPPTVAAAVPP